MQNLLYQGAEAKIYLIKNPETIYSKKFSPINNLSGRVGGKLSEEINSFIIKDRIKKSYRLAELDKKIRKQRTKSEAKLLKKASEIIDCPKPFFIPDFYQIKMPFINGKKLSEHLDNFSPKKQKQICRQIGESVAKLHHANIIHGDLTTSNMILVEKENDNSLSRTEKFKKQLIELRKLNLPNEEYAVFGSGPLAIHGIRDTDDIDVIVKPKLWDKLVKKYSQENEKLIKIGFIEFYKNWLPWFDDTNKLIDNADIFNDIRFVKLKYVLSWKKAYDREKDKRDIQLIKQYQSASNSECIKIYFIDFGLGFTSHKIEDKAVDLHLLKQALEARHFTNWNELFSEVVKSYEKINPEVKKILERLKAVERRGRYKG